MPKKTKVVKSLKNEPKTLEMDRLRERGTIDSVFLGEEDHGILTCSIGVKFSGTHQGFGNLCLGNAKYADDFVACLCRTFGVATLDGLKGKACYALRCFDSLSTQIEGLEAETGARFMLTSWRRRHWPETKSPLEEARASLESTLDHLRRRLAETSRDLNSVSSRYFDWEKQRQ